MNKNTEWQTIIGLEIHAQLATKSKIFSGSSTKYGAAPNTQANAVDLGLPGVLPVINEQAIFMAVKFGLAIGAEIPKKSIFARKNYFYPDLPKGYQISQFELPIVSNGQIEIDIDENNKKIIRITRAHLEEDAGKSNHDDFLNNTGVDLNRAGNPLLEIVSEPDMNNAKEAVNYLKKIHSLVQYLKICDGNMQEGSFRCDVNISIRPSKEAELGTRVEIKNLNSFKFIEKSNDIYGYQNFVCDTSGSICEVVNPEDPNDPLLSHLAEDTLIILIKGSRKHKEQLIKRFKKDPKPIYYNEDFLNKKWSNFKDEFKVSNSNVDPDKFILYCFEELLDYRTPIYNSIAKNWGITIDADDISKVKNENDATFLDVYGVFASKFHHFSHLS